MNRINTLAPATVVAVAAACSNTAKGVGQDAENAGDKATEMARTASDSTASAAAAGSSIGAAMETADVKTALIANTRVDAGDINVDTNKETKTVTLNGTTKTEAQKKLAGEVAASKAPGHAIVNNLTIEPK